MTTFRTMEDVTNAIQVVVDNSTGKDVIQYPITFKKKLMEYVVTENINLKELTKITPIGYSTLSSWRQNYNLGFFSEIPEDSVHKQLKRKPSLKSQKEQFGVNATKPVISNKPNTLNGPILIKLNKQLEELTNKIRIIEEAEAMGFKVSIAK